MGNDTSGLFRDLTENRRSRGRSRHTWGVFPIGVNGKPYKTPSTTHRTQEQAERQAAMMTSYPDNAGKTFVAKPL